MLFVIIVLLTSGLMAGSAGVTPLDICSAHSIILMVAVLLSNGSSTVGAHTGWLVKVVGGVAGSGASGMSGCSLVGILGVESMSSSSLDVTVASVSVSVSLSFSGSMVVMSDS